MRLHGLTSRIREVSDVEMASLALKTLLILFCISFLFAIAPNPEVESGHGYGGVFSAMVSLVSGDSSGIVSFFANASALLAASVAIGVITGLFLYQNPYMLFGAISAFILSFVTIPVDLFKILPGGTPPELTVFITTLFGLLIIVSVVSFFRGYEA